MIFDRERDKILELIANNDLENQDKILNFINDIPVEFLIIIQKGIEEYNKYIENKDKNKKKKIFCGEYNVDNKYLYSFEIDNDILYVCRSSFKYGVYFRDFELRLGKYSPFEKIQNIGGISIDYNVETQPYLYLKDYTDINYEIRNGFFGRVLCSKKNDGSRKKLVREKNIRKDKNDI